MPASYYVKGQWNVLCDSCGLKKKSGQIARRWDGLMVCRDTCWEPDHPQKYIRVREDGQAVPFIREDNMSIAPYVCYIYAIAGYADLGEADCMRADIASPSYTFLLALKTASLG